jgi:hypothetical protein
MSDDLPKLGRVVSAIIFYRPLLIVTGISLTVAIAVSLTGHIHFMNAWMGLFLLLLAFLKFLNLSGFTKSFARYDIVAARLPVYAKAYPFVELALAALFLTGAFPLFTNIVMMLVMAVGSIGVVKTLRSGVCLKCACVGSGFDIPVGKVTLFENGLMFAMAAMNLVSLLNY